MMSAWPWIVSAAVAAAAGADFAPTVEVEEVVTSYVPAGQTGVEASFSDFLHQYAARGVESR